MQIQMNEQGDEFHGFSRCDIFETLVWSLRSSCEINESSLRHTESLHPSSLITNLSSVDVFLETGDV